MSQTELTEPQKILKNILSVTEGFAALGIDCEISGCASHTTVDLAYSGATPKRLTIYPNKKGTKSNSNDMGTSHTQDNNHSQASVGKSSNYAKTGHGPSSSRNGRNDNSYRRNNNDQGTSYSQVNNYPQGSKNKGNNKKGNKVSSHYGGNSHGLSSSKGTGNSNFKGRNSNSYQVNNYPASTSIIDLDDMLYFDLDDEIERLYDDWYHTQ
ncbi:insoluble matrix shell protein 4-like [Drosophila willistoni]|uniref:GK21868 n=1 Tax=Drosophila willistoni TaxID=7260 RepID=B4MQG5_DROWI|nr:insoluble matrix shell protein 4-like [Drosophila willistoni]XP_046865899.1 insoluble matrix shell protein 4-like [Drosophila willistoni]